MYYENSKQTRASKNHQTLTLKDFMNIYKKLSLKPHSLVNDTILSQIILSVLDAVLYRIRHSN